MSLSVLSFLSTDVSAKNIIKNGNFSGDLGGVGLANSWSFSSENGAENARVENNTQFWTAKSSTWGGSIKTESYFYPRENHKYYIRAECKNVDYVRNSGDTSKYYSEFSNDGKNSGVITFSQDYSKTYFYFEAKEIDIESSIRYVLVIDLTETFGEDNEPTATQMDTILEQFPNSWFDGSQNLFNARHFMSMYFDKMAELDSVITELGGTDI